MAIHLQYFINREGQIAIPPDAEAASIVLKDPRWAGYELREANDIHEVDRLQKRLQQQTWDELQREGEQQASAWEERLKAQRDRLIAKAVSAATTQYEKDFFREWLKLKDEQRREKFKQRYLCDMAAYSFFEQREFDKPRNAEETLKESL